MPDKVKVKTNGDDFARLECGHLEIEMSKDGDSEACPNSWTYGMWYDGNEVANSCDEKSYAETLKEAICDIEEIMGDYGQVLDYLKAFDVMAGGK